MERVDIKIQLIGDAPNSLSGYLDIKDSTDFPITLAVGDIRDVSKKTGSFSKTIKLTNSKNNNILLNNYFDVNVVDGGLTLFNINRIQKCNVLIDNVPFLNDAYIQLLSANKTESTDLHTDTFEYSIQIKDNISDLFIKIKDLELTDINFDGFEHLYNEENIIDSWENPNSVYKYVLPYSDDSVDYIPINNFRPGIKLKYYWDRIFAQSGYSYNWPTMNDYDFEDLIIPYNGEDIPIPQDELDDYFVYASMSSTPYEITSATLSGVLATNFQEKLIADGEIYDPANLYTPGTGEYEAFFFTGVSDGLSYNININYDVIVNNLEGVDTFLVVEPNFFQQKIISKTIFSVRKNGSGVYSSNLVTNNISLFANDGTTYSVGENVVGSFTTNANLIVGSEPGDIFTLDMRINNEPVVIGGNSIRFRQGTDLSDPLSDVNMTIRINSYNIEIKPSLGSIAFNSTINLNRFIPKKVKQADLIKSICTMFNLFIETDKYNKSLLNIISRDDYYDAGAIKDWTRLLNKNENQEITFLSEITKKRMLLTYKEDKDYWNTFYKDSTEEIYGQQEFTFDSEYVQDIDKKEIIFSPTPIVKNAHNQVTTTIPGNSPKNNIRLLYSPDELFDCNQWRILKYGTTLDNNAEYSDYLTQYPLFSHFNKPMQPTKDINFGICDKYFIDGLQITNDNLYNLNWRRTFNQLDNSKMLTAYFDLTTKEMLDLKLNAKIRIDNSYWNINKIIDYNPNKPGPTKVELISIDEELKLARFITSRPPIKPTPGGPIIFDPVGPVVGPIRDTRRDITRNNNRILSSGDGTINGIGNQIDQSVKYYNVDGNDNLISSENVTVNGDSNIIESDGIVFGDANYIPTGIDGVMIFGSGVTASETGIYVNNINVSESITIEPGVPITGLGLPEVLGDDNTSGGNNIIMSLGDVIKGTGTASINLNREDADEILISLDSTGFGDDGDNFISIDRDFFGGGRIDLSSDGSINMDVNFTSGIDILEDYVYLYNFDSSNGSGIYLYADRDIYMEASNYTELITTTFSVDVSGFRLLNAPTTDNSNTKLVARNTTTGYLELVDKSSITIPAGTIDTISSTSSITETYTICTMNNAYTVTLPDASLHTGEEFTIKVKNNADTNTLTITSAGGSTIDDETFYYIKTNYESITVFSDGSDWWIK